MNFLIIASSPYSHILPLKVLADKLNSYKDSLIYCMSVKENKNMITEFGMKFIEYPDGIKPVSTGRVDINELMSKTMEFWNKDEIENGYNYFIEKDIESLYDVTYEQIEKITHVIESLKINVIFRDAIDKFGNYIAKKLDIPIIGYITHNLYSKNFFELEPNYLYPIFLNALIDNRLNKLPKDYFVKYRNKCEYLYDKFAQEYGPFKIPPLHQFDPLNNLSIIFSTNYLQPKQSLYVDRKYMIIYPNITERENEEIPDKLEKFLNKYKKVIYISSGSITTQSTKYYIDFINALSQGEYGIVISAGIQNEILQDYVIKNKLDNKVYISKWIPQRYMLNRSVLFISSGGQNSILEAMYYKVPMLITPMSSEQRINGVIVERLGIGYTTYNIRSKHLSTGQMINSLLNDKNIKDKLKILSQDYKEHKNDFSNLDKFLKMVKKNEQ